MNRPVKPLEARELAHAVRHIVDRPGWRHAPTGTAYPDLPRVDGLRASATRVLELLLRLANEDHVVRRTTSWIARNLDLGHSTVQRARRELEAAGLVLVIERGLGHTASLYRVFIERIRELVAGAAADTSPDLSGRPLTPPGEATAGLSGRPLGPLGEATQRAGSRDARIPVLTSNPPLPPDDIAAGDVGGEEGHPPVSDGAPPDEPSKCEHGRSGRQGCRRCGTTPRQLEAAAKERGRREAAAKEQQRRAERLRQEAAAAEETRRIDRGDWAAFAREQMGRGRPVEAANGSRRTP